MEAFAYRLSVNAFTNSSRRRGRAVSVLASEDCLGSKLKGVGVCGLQVQKCCLSLKLVDFFEFAYF